VDPLLTVSCPPAVTAASGMDALTQCLEPFVSPMANPLTDAVAREGIRRAAAGLRRAYADGSDIGARADMAVASVAGGMALANAKLGAGHGLAGVIGGTRAKPHGLGRAPPPSPGLRADRAGPRGRPAGPSGPRPVRRGRGPADRRTGRGDRRWHRLDAAHAGAAGNPRAGRVRPGARAGR